MELTQEYLKTILHYDPDTGLFTWRRRPDSHFKSTEIAQCRNTRWAGTIAGSAGQDGYRRISLSYKIFLAHRLAFLYMEGLMPPDQVDHINGVRTDNRWQNLRHADQTQQSRNQKRSKLNKSGVTGVFWANSKSKWIATCGRDGNKIYLGRFDDFFEAVCARKSADIEYGYHKNHGRCAE